MKLENRPKEGITDVCVYLVRSLALLHLNQFEYPGKSGVLGTNLYLHKKLVLVRGKVDSSSSFPLHSHSHSQPCILLFELLKEGVG